MKEEILWDQGVHLLKSSLAGDGAFLVAVDEEGRANPMTIGWGEVGIVWGRPVFTVLVRRSRYTYGCLLFSKCFTVNVPASGKLKEALTLCGTRSGRDLDKMAAAGLTVIPGRKVDIPIIAECALHYECRILLRKQLARADFSAPAVLSEYYRDNDHHLLVSGEILAAYADQAVMN